MEPEEKARQDQIKAIQEGLKEQETSAILAKDWGPLTESLTLAAAECADTHEPKAETSPGEQGQASSLSQKVISKRLELVYNQRLQDVLPAVAQLTVQPNRFVTSLDQMDPLLTPKCCCFDTASEIASWVCHTLCTRCSTLSQLVQGEWERSADRKRREVLREPHGDAAEADRRLHLPSGQEG